jgi:hypothetical protein
LLVIAIIIIAMLVSGDDVDYVATVKQHAPFRSQGINATYQQVFSRFLTSPNWSVNNTGDNSADVIVSGTLRGQSGTISVTIRVVVDGDNARITPNRVTLYGVTYSGNDAVEILLDMFWSFADGDSVW